MSGRSWRVMLCRVVSPHICNIWSCFVTSRDAILRKAMSYRSREVISFLSPHLLCHFFPSYFHACHPMLSYLLRKIMTCYHTFIVWFYVVSVLNVSTRYLIPTCLDFSFHHIAHLSSHNVMLIASQITSRNCIHMSPHRLSLFHFYPQQTASMGLTVSCKTAKEFSH